MVSELLLSETGTRLRRNSTPRALSLGLVGLVPLAAAGSGGSYPLLEQLVVFLSFSPLR